MGNTCTLEEEILTPTLKDIIADYNEVVNLLSNVTDIEELRKISKREHITIEINGDVDYDNKWEDIVNSNAPIHWVRVDAYHWLDYIYFFYEDGKLSIIYFDVWSNEVDADFMMHCTIDTLEEKYKLGIDWINSIV